MGLLMTGAVSVDSISPILGTWRGGGGCRGPGTTLWILHCLQVGNVFSWLRQHLGFNRFG